MEKKVSKVSKVGEGKKGKKNPFTKNAVAQFFHGYDKRVAKVVDSAVEMTSEDAAKLPSPLKGAAAEFDTPVTIHVGGFAEEWKSRFLCYHFYHTAGVGCLGSSEGSRYFDVAYGVYFGEETPTDGIPLRDMGGHK